MAVNVDAKIGDGAVLLIGGTNVSTTATPTQYDTSEYTQIAQVVTCNPNLECSEHDVTHFGSAGKRQFIPGHVSGTVQMTGRLIPAQYVATTSQVVDSVDLLSTTYFNGRATKPWILSIPQAQDAGSTSALTHVYCSFAGFITSLNWSVDTDNPNGVDMTIRLADSIFTNVGTA